MCCIKSLFVISLALATTLAYPFEDNNLYKHCYKPCTFIYAPVCGFDGYKHQKFPSECVMEIENCILQAKKSKVFMKTVLQMCEEKQCNMKCTKEYDPICAFDGENYRTFSNKCNLETENCLTNNKWHRVKSGQCQNKSEKNCNQICTLDYNPVCATDGAKIMTYSNTCFYESANCEANYKLRLLRNGECY